MMHFYSQGGEDYLVWKLLDRQQRASGYYVEVGALDGRRFSNSYAFEQIGWPGICVEAHPDYYQQARRNRPGATVVHAACCDRDDHAITFHANARGTLSAIAWAWWADEGAAWWRDEGREALAWWLDEGGA